MTIFIYLRECGLLPTEVIFFADNGRLEARGIHYLWDWGIHVPMIICWPEKIPASAGYVPGTVNSDMISLIDLTATTLSIAGISKPPLMQSRIFLGAEKDEFRTFVFSARDRIDETVNRIRSVREKKYHYIRNFIPGEGFTSLNRYQEKCFLVKPLILAGFLNHLKLSNHLKRKCTTGLAHRTGLTPTQQLQMKPDTSGRSLNRKTFHSLRYCRALPIRGKAGALDHLWPE